MPAEQKVDRHRRWKLRCPAEAPVDGVEQRNDVLVRAIEDHLGQLVRGAGQPIAEGVRFDRFLQFAGLVQHVGTLVHPNVGDGFHDAHETGHAVSVRRRKVRAAVERLAVGREEDRHRPSAAFGHGLHGGHVDGVDVGTLFAVDLHVDEESVHHRGDLGVLERLVGHHVAPVARGIADREENRTVLGPRPIERLGTPRIPVDGVVGVLAQVRAGFVAEAIHFGQARARVARVPVPRGRRPTR